MIGFSKDSTKNKATSSLLVTLLESIDKRLADLVEQTERSSTTIEKYLKYRKSIEENLEPTEADEKY